MPRDGETAFSPPMVQGNQALIEYTMAGTIRGEPCERLGMCAYGDALGEEEIWGWE